MAQVAYDLERFAPSGKEQKPRVRVAPKREGKKRLGPQLARMMRTLAMTAILLALVTGVLYTQTTLTELQADIESLENTLTEEKANNAYLTFELEGMTNLRNLEQQAQELGMVPMDNGQITYVRLEDTNEIEVRENWFVRVWNSFSNAMMSIWEYIWP